MPAASILHKNTTDGTYIHIYIYIIQKLKNRYSLNNSTSMYIKWLFTQKNNMKKLAWNIKLYIYIYYVEFTKNENFTLISSQNLSFWSCVPFKSRKILNIKPVPISCTKLPRINDVLDPLCQYRHRVPILHIH